MTDALMKDVYAAQDRRTLAKKNTNRALKRLNELLDALQDAKIDLSAAYAEEDYAVAAYNQLVDED